MLQKILKFLWIKQEKIEVKYCNGYNKPYRRTRTNPYNPITYLYIIIYYSIIIVFGGFYEIYKYFKEVGINKIIEDFKWH